LGWDERVLLIKAVQTILPQTRELLATSGAGKYFETWGVLTEQEAKYILNMSEGPNVTKKKQQILVKDLNQRSFFKYK